MTGMTNRIEGVLLTFPPRRLAPDERAVLNAWLAATCDVASAYVSERRSDDPAQYRRIVVTVGPTRKPSHLVHAPSGLNCWLVTTLGEGGGVLQYDSLRAALNSIRQVFTADHTAAL